MRVKGPNGLVCDLEESVARSLIGKGNRGYEAVEDEKKAETKSATKKSSSPKK